MPHHTLNPELVLISDRPFMDEVSATTTTNDPVEEVAARIEIKPMPRWMIPSIVLHAALLAGVLYAVHAFGTRIDGLQASVGSTRDNVAELAKSMSQESGALKTETAGLKTEVENLRQYIASNSSEDVIFLKITILKSDIDTQLARDIARHVHRYSELYGRDSNLVLAMIATESNFNPKAVSHMGAVGLMQVMPQWKKVLAIDGDLNDLEVSIKVGLQILGFYTEMYKDLEMALTAYNRGPGPVDWALMKGQDPKNKYAPRVLGTYERLKKLSVRSVG
jgi:soluble lytic murein transglycosylase-like protein